MERALQIFAVVHLTVVGLSHVLQHRAWAEFFILLREKGHPGVFAHGFLSLGFASMILGFHRVWSGLPAVLTIVGVLYLLKTLHCFLLPALALRSLNRVSLDRSPVFILPGLMYLAVAATLAYGLARHG